MPSLALRGEIVTFDDDPRSSARALRHYPDGFVVIDAGRVVSVSEAPPPGIAVDDHRGRLILPGFIDAHIHYPQTDVIASPGEQLLGWLERYTFPAERAFADPRHAEAMAGFFLDQLLRNGTTSAAVFATVHAHSADALFAAAQARRMRIASGKVLMDRNCPDYLRDTAQTGYEESKALIERWHGCDRLVYAVTPRYAASSSPDQLAAAGRLVAEHPGVLMQTHISENRDEVAWVRELFPGSRNYLDVYDRAGLVGARSLFAHAIWLEDAERSRLAQARGAIAFCPGSNFFLGSGVFSYAKAHAAQVGVGLGTDIGAGTSFSQLATMRDAYHAARLLGEPFSAFDAFYLATLGAARALGMQNEVGSIAPGREADLVVLDPGSTPLLARRSARAESLEEKLFALMMLGDERAVADTYVLGEKLRHR